jgi:penicillin-binding protein 2
MYENRIKVIFIIVILMFMGLLARIFYLQIYSGRTFTNEASAQRTSISLIEKPRGDILDRNSIPFTNRDKKLSLVLEPLVLRGKDDEIKKLSEVLGLESRGLIKEIEIKKEPILVEIEEQKKKDIMNLNLQGISYINSLSRFGYNSVAKHVVGYINQKDLIGEAGIEKYYNKTLETNIQDFIGVALDAQNNLLQGLGYRIIKPKEKTEKLNVKLTLDYHIQKIVEDVMNNKNILGAVVIEDVANGNVLAMSSKPDFDPKDIGSYLDNTKYPLFNRAVASYNLGSIFKIVDLALMFESNFKYNNDFFCPGYIKVGDKEFKCSSYEKGGHGTIGLNSAFALSCNSYFIDMGIKMGYRYILEMAQKFGLGHATGINEQGVDESQGMLPDINGYHTDGDTANISIGQGQIMATPLQVADMIATIANGGIKNKVNIVDSIVDDTGKNVKNIRSDAAKRIISKETADSIKALMEDVTSSGTGTKANLDKYGGAGGKTGSAETGQYINNEKVTHAWFAGYFPKRNPKYSMTVFVEDGKVGGEFAAPIFEEIAEEMVKEGF